ncbi:hypothetical protein [Virgisporangium aurantiacum]|uniref:Uncharacterized protein n=1 Tax=Virgisporangium aurantiacum TaxID=175570 RepID=A0A8J3ZCQ0_9ACTN|nr:hypothetical protein [Virgisporangium aurantiacum]GIJ59325.1 hypothetical protein Vau01_068410 [Virgisporangium aurantiacum]
MVRRAALVIAVLALGLVGPAVPAQAAQPTFDEFSRLSVRSAGQYWSGNQVGGQWAWSPQSATESGISWGDPATWPPTSMEMFRHEGDWLLLDGWKDNGTYYTVRVTQEQIGDGTCADLRPVPAAGGRQHYVQWTVPAQAYCLKAWGTITEQSSGKVVDFGHTQIWSPPAACGNAYFTGQTCVKQWESWWDNRGTPGTPITRKLERDQYIARGLGMAFRIQQYYPSSWRADLRYSWTW